MSIDPDEMSVEVAAAEILKPIDDLLAKEAEELKEADEMIDVAETKARKIIIAAKRIDEE
jgi:hypothetical protein